MNRLVSRHPVSISLVAAVLAVVISIFLIDAPKSAAMVTGFTVDSTADAPDANPGDGICDDGSGNCTLRAAIMESDFIGGANVITVPAGTYTLLGPVDDEYNGAGATLESGDLDIVDLSAFSLPQLTSVTINGAGAATTIIDGGGNDRVIDVNNFAVAGAAVNVTLTGLTIRNGNAPTSPEGFNESGGGIQFDGFDNQTFVPTGTLTINNCKITSNTSAGQGGGILAIFGSLVMDGSEVSGNTSVKAAGGGISYDASAFSGLRTLQVTNGKISGNHANNSIFGSGGGIWEGGNANKTINYNVITGNTAAVFGGGVFNGSGNLALNYNVIVGNTATANPTSSGFRNNTGATSVLNDWWGCNQGPGSSPCDRASGFTASAWLTLNHTATPNSVSVNQATTLQADFFTNSASSTVAASDLVALNGRAIVFNNAVNGAISGADTQISGGKAMATFTAGNTGGTGSADATVDQATVTALITIGQPASVATNPTNQTVCDGGTATFTASGNGSPAPTVQWQVSTGGPFSDIPGATSTTLSFTATTAQNGNQYRAVFTNTGGSATTTAATLTVNTAPTVSSNPSNTTVCEGATAMFTASANGSPAPTVQWQVSTGGPFSNIPGATSTTLSFTATTAQNGNQYRAVFTNACSSATTTAATLTVNASTTATDVSNQIACQGATANFSTTAGGTAPFHYAWTLDGNATGTDSPNLAVNTSSLSISNHSVSVVVSGTCGNVTKNATLTVNANTTTTDPADQFVCVSDTASFTTTASGTGPFSFVWKKGVTVLNNGDLGGRVTITNGTNTSTLSISNAQATDAGSYTVETTGACNTASQSANLAVNSTPPVIVLNGNNITLWPPNHQYHTVNVTDLVSGVTDSCDSLSASDVTIASVTSDEVEDAPSGGDGNTFNDIVISCNRHSVQLRQERDGNLNGRVYTITFTVTDSHGHVGTATAKVSVPVNQNGAAAIDSGPHYTVVNATCP